MSKLVCSVDVDRPVDVVYARWLRLEDLPAITRHVHDVHQRDGRTSAWDVRIGGERRCFTAVTSEQVPGLRVAWSGHGDVTHVGVVTFHRLDASRTRVTLQLDWEPIGLFDQVGDRTGLVRRAVADDLEAFARHVEAATPAGATVATGGDGRSRSDDAIGRSAESPTDIPARGWKMVLKRTFQQVKSDNVPVVAGGVAYYSFLALVPALAAVISIYGLVAEPADVGRQLRSLFAALPTDAANLLREQVRTITAANAGGLGAAAAIGILGSLWSATRGMQALVAALNIAYDEEETRKGLRLKARTITMTVASALVVTLVVGGMVAVGAAADALPTAAGWTLSALRWPVLFGLLVLGLAVLYRYGPDRDEPAWRWVTPGAALAALLLVAGSFVFAVYVDNFGSYSKTYGSLGAIVVLLLWLNLTAYVVVVGAELDSELERQTAEDTTKGPEQPLGERQAFAADTVAA